MPSHALRIQSMRANEIAVNGQNGNAIAVFATKFGIAVNIDDANVLGAIVEDCGQLN
jgi:hypothetical protein